MARRSKPERALGPYRHHKRWRVFVVSAGGEKTPTDYESEEEAKQVIRSLRRELAKGGDRTVVETRRKYEEYMREEKGNKPRSIEATSWRLGIFFSEPEQKSAPAVMGVARDHGARVQAPPAQPW